VFLKYVSQLYCDLCSVLQFGLFFVPQDELKLAVKQGATLLTCIREPVTRSANSKLSPDELENVATVERLVKIDYLAQVANLFLRNANVIYVLT